MHAFARHRTDYGARVGVENVRLRRVGDVQPVRGGIHGQIVPPAIATDGNFFQEMIAWVRGSICAEHGHARHGHKTQRNKRKIFSWIYFHSQNV